MHNTAFTRPTRLRSHLIHEPLLTTPTLGERQDVPPQKPAAGHPRQHHRRRRRRRRDVQLRLWQVGQGRVKWALPAL